MYRLDIELSRLEFMVHPDMALEDMLVGGAGWGGRLRRGRRVHACVALWPLGPTGTSSHRWVAHHTAPRHVRPSTTRGPSPHVVAQAARLLAAFREFKRREAVGLAAYYANKLAALEVSEALGW